VVINLNAKVKFGAGAVEALAASRYDSGFTKTMPLRLSNTGGILLEFMKNMEN
jgi:hypothetical protein